MIKIEHIIFSNTKREDVDGFYDIKYHNSKIEYNGITYTYLASGGCRKVYIDPDKKYVIKLPKHHGNDIPMNGVIYNYLFEDVNKLQIALNCDVPISELHTLDKFIDESVRHNIYEAHCYNSAPESHKKFLAKTELLPNCWIKQEYVNTISIQGWGSSCREIGVRDNRETVLFDFDELLCGGWEWGIDLYMTIPPNGYEWSKLSELIEYCNQYPDVIKFKNKLNKLNKQ